MLSYAKTQDAKQHSLFAQKKEQTANPNAKQRRMLAPSPRKLAKRGR